MMKHRACHAAAYAVNNGIAGASARALFDISQPWENGPPACAPVRTSEGPGAQTRPAGAKAATVT
jgi:hypothetical protein